RGVLHDRPGVVVQVHVHEHVAREDALLRLHLLAVLRLDHLFGGDDDTPEAGALTHGLDPVLEIGLHLVLVPGVGVDHIPAKHSILSIAAARAARRTSTADRSATGR